MYQVSFGNRGTKFTAVLGGKMLRNLVCYSITTELKLKCPTCTQLMSFSALRKTFCFESMFCRLETTKRTHTSVFALLCLIARKTANEVLLFCASSLSRNQSSDKLITFSASRDSILDYCASILDTQCMRVSRIESRIETRKRLSTYI